MLALITKTPKDVPWKTIADVENIDIGLGRILYEYCFQWAVRKFSISKSRLKK